ncbi:2-hexaprenyl-6-methoxy-1,4-benzoquinone methyltransferase [Tilletia horrida]|uniref:2-methoxy-6-polyprenyl-1,4-benzoquinol methylase, mitochondrial n=1 Tax=Tilletia horrida TaxID=155126 RepID=A0AAN6JUB9_9BASI|nr:2-hexaprenyl-6-methoxy-1,4-benzoquinone methyltransferase [Tilletia horrida]KAK0556860.1 2-hexaprenyl-6-methoxy-1,4-benzoquinone methyltransferase [Tilletia horrida]KAK0569206.1 2-hexaprenyl-6-methoxy-1,4-benzoquinone methyltransferase [Tilletia horrida]
MASLSLSMRGAQSLGQMFAQVAQRSVVRPSASRPNRVDVLNPSRSQIRCYVQGSAARSPFRASESRQESTRESSGTRTHFGFKDVAEDDKEGLVGGVFSSVASSYDLMNDAMSLGIHRLWKDHFVKTLDPRSGIHCLDVAGGTGDIALRILDHAREKYADREIKVTMLDINPKMLWEGQRRVKKTMYWNTPQIDFRLGNAEALGSTMPVPSSPASYKIPPLKSEPIADNSVDLYTIAFGIRNCTHIDRVLAEAYRVLKPGGVFACLEFGKVTVPPLAELYRQYSFTFIPSLGHILAGDRDSYQYLIESIERFPTQPEFARMIRNAGFELPGSPAAAALGFDSLNSDRSQLKAVSNALDNASTSAAQRLGYTPNSTRSSQVGDQDVRGSWEDLTLGIATIWMGYVLKFTNQ